ncbi:MAG: hypothetical protein ACRELG_26755 [Gemmataceae bacterium]
MDLDSTPRRGFEQMACLSWRREGSKAFTVAANPIYPLTAISAPLPDRIEFEILESDAALLAAHIGTPQTFYIDGESGVFFARVSQLVPEISTHPDLALSRDKPTLRACLEIFNGSPSVS